jgi:hypothetical protein
MTGFGVRVERLYCPIGSCGWTLDRECPPATTHTFPDGQSPLHDGPAANLQEAIADVAYATLLHDAVETEGIVRAHLDTHPLLDWVTEVMRLRANKPPATVYQVGIFDYDLPDQVELFSNPAAAAAYKALLPGADLEGITVLDQSPTRVTVHYYETWVLPDGVTMNPRPPHLHYTKHERWSHDLWPPAEQWTHPGSHTHVVRPTTEPVVCVLETTGFDQRATWQAHVNEAARLRKAAGDG